MQPRADSPGLGMGLPTIGQLTTSVDIREGPRGAGTEVRMRFAAPGVAGPAGGVGEGDERYRLLADVSAVAQGGGWPAHAINRLVDVLVPAVADACAVDVVDHEGRAQRLAERADGAHELPEPAASTSSETLRSGGSIMAELDPSSGLARWVTLPLVQDGRVLGLLHLGMSAERGAPAPEHVAFLETLAERAAVGLANTQLVDALRRTQRRLERILGVLGEAVTVHDAEGRTVYANEAAVRLLGVRSAEEILTAEPGQLAARFLISLEDGTPVRVRDLPGRRLLLGEPAEPLLTRSVNRATGQARWLLTKATLLDDDGPLAVNIIEDVTEAKEAALRQGFLARAGEVLGASLDLSRTLQDVADLVVPDLADWCVVDLIAAPGRLERVAVAHKDPIKLAVARLIDERYPSNPEPVPAVLELLAGGPAQLIPELTDEMLASRAEDDEHLELLRKVGMRSILLLPMRVGDRTIGLLTMISAESARSFDVDDLAFGAEVARRAAVAVENARLYAERAGA
jgi:PAS domain S-box-containing protein